MPCRPARYNTVCSERHSAAEERRLRRLLRKILWPNKEKRAVQKTANWWASWQRMRLAEHVTRTETRNVYVVVVGRETAWKTRPKLECNRCVWCCKTKLGAWDEKLEDNIKMKLEQDSRMCTGNIWLRMGTVSRLLWSRQWISWTYKMLEITWLAEEILSSQGGL